MPRSHRLPTRNRVCRAFRDTAIFTQGLYSYVFVEHGVGVLQRRQVTLGLQGHPYSYVKEGLKAGERVVTTGALLLNAELAGKD